MAKFVDAHVHCYEIERDALYGVLRNGFAVVCVSSDLESSVKTLGLTFTNGVVPCIGVHPWVVHEEVHNEFFALLDRVVHGIRCLGEVGLDKKFYPHTYGLQEVFFKKILVYAKEYGLVLNLHAAGAWRDVFEHLLRSDVDKAYFHWYTGPLDLMDEIASVGYYIGLNAAWVIQDKHRLVVDKAPLEWVLTESDSPYTYRGVELKPEMVIDTLKRISITKNLDLDKVTEAIHRNFAVLYGSHASAVA